MFSHTPPEPPAPEPAEPPEPSLDDMQAALTQAMTGFLQLREALAPAFDAADGMRADLTARGWSPGSAELLAMTWLQRALVNLTPIGGPQ